MADKPKVINDSKKFVDELTKGRNVAPAKELTTRPKPKAPSPQGKAIGEDVDAAPYKKGGKVKKYANGGSVGRGDGCASKGKTRCRVI